MSKLIKINNAKENNLKDISVNIPKECICGICGVSGSGKSTLACEVIAKYALEAFALSMSVKLRRKLSDGKMPKVDKIENLPSVVLIDIKNANRSVRSTVATTSGLMTILRNMFSFCGKPIINGQTDDKHKVHPRLFSYNISESEGGGACPCCGGTGNADVIQPEAIINDAKKSVLLGAFHVVNARGVKYTKISDLFIKAFCKEYGIDIEKSVNCFSKAEMELLLFGSNKIIKFVDRTGANGGKKELAFPGIIGSLLDVYGRTKNASIEKFVTKGVCNSCRGSRYNMTALEYKVAGYSISDFMKMNISNARKVISNLAQIYGRNFEGVAEEFLVIALELENIGVGYLKLGRPVSTLSGGELQRIKLAKQIAMKLQGICYVIDEPSTGLHDSNIVQLMKSIERLKENHNTVLLVEHNPLILNTCDYLVELGIRGGSQGGDIVAVGTPKEIIQKDTLTGKMLKRNISMLPKKENGKKKKLGIYGVSENNLKGVDIEIPLNSFIAVVGVSGSGKSSAINSLYSTIKKYIETGKKEYDLIIEEDIESIVRLDQNASVANSRSNISSLLGVLDAIRLIYSRLEQSKKMGLDSSAFSKNNKLGACSLCGGTGVLVDEDKYEEICDACDGTGYRGEILEVKYKGYNIAELMALTIDELIKVIDDSNINKILTACKKIGLGYLSLDRKSPSLSKGEYQRIRIVTEICKSNTSKTIYILDEPSKGLHFSDVNKIIQTLRELVNADSTVIAIEHNLDVIMSSDYVLEFGPDAGNDGGTIVYCGATDKLCTVNTHTAQAIKGIAYEKMANQCENTSDKIKLQSTKFEFEIDKRCINILKGPIGSGKSSVLRNLLFANPLKRYIVSISNQGKYLTRHIFAEKNQGDVLPITRLICDDVGVFGKNERVLETLNLTSLTETMFYEYGEHDGSAYRSSFNFAKKAGKCCSCSGKGRITSYDFDMIFSDQQCEQALYDLLNERTRFSRISPLLKSKYKIDISKKYDEMSEEEKQLFLYGDKKKTVYYALKKKEYYWEGCNTILFSNMVYSSQILQERIKPTYLVKTCKYCEGLGIDKKLAKSTYKGITYKRFNSITIEELYLNLKQTKMVRIEEQMFMSVLEKLIEFGAKDIKLSDYTAELNLERRMIIQYVSYRMNPLSETMIVWDDFGTLKNIVARNNIINDLLTAISEDTTILLVDNNLKMSGANEIYLGEKEDVFTSSIGDMKNVMFVEDNKALKKENLKSIISTRNTFGNYLGIVGLLRKEFKKKYKKYNFTGVKADEKCEKCEGTGYYELDMGDIGICKCECPDCEGSGFSSGVNSCYMDDKNIGNVLKLPLNDLFMWCTKMRFKNIADKLEIFICMGLVNVSISEKIRDFSSNEKILFALSILLGQDRKEIVIKDFSNTIPEAEYMTVISRLNDMACKKNKEVIIVKEC